MAKLSLYTNKYGGTVEAFELAEIADDITWYDYVKNKDIYDARLYSVEEFANGMKQVYITIQNPDILNKLPSDYGLIKPIEHKRTEKIEDETSFEYIEVPETAWEKIEEEPDDWDENWWYYAKDYTYKATSTSTEILKTAQPVYDRKRLYTVPPTFNSSNTYMLKGDRKTLQPFWTFGGNGFVTAHYAQGSKVSGYSPVYTWGAGLLKYGEIRNGYDNIYPYFYWYNGDYHDGTIYSGSNRLHDDNAAGYYLEEFSFSNFPTKSPLSIWFCGGTVPAGTNIYDQYSKDKNTDKDINFVGVITIRRNADGIVSTAKIQGMTLDYWQTPGTKGTWGAATGIEGGNGLFKADSASVGDKDGSSVKQKVQQSNIPFDSVYSAHGFHLHRLPPQSFQLLIAGLLSTNYLERFKQSFYNPLSAVIRLFSLPSYIGNMFNNSIVSGVLPSDIITLAGYEFAGVSGDRITQPFIDLHIGTVDLSQPFYDAYPDFEPYTKMTLHLPFAGDIDIAPALCNGGTLSLDAILDRSSGNINYIVTTQDRNQIQTGAYYQTYRATGNCGYNLPLAQGTGDNLGNAIRAIGGIVVNPSIGSIASGVANTVFTQQGVATKGEMGGSFAPIDDGIIYLYVQRRLWNNPDNYDSLVGIPSDISGTISANAADFSAFGGYLKCKVVDVRSISRATESEKQEIENLLKSGIYI